MLQTKAVATLSHTTEGNSTLAAVLLTMWYVAVAYAAVASTRGTTKAAVPRRPSTLLIVFHVSPVQRCRKIAKTGLHSIVPVF